MPKEIARILTKDKLIADYFEDSLKYHNYPKLLGSWIANDIIGYLNRNNLDSTALKIAPEKLSQLANAVSDSKINELTAKSILIKSLTSDQDIAVLLNSEVGKSVDNEQLIQIIDDIFNRANAYKNTKTNKNILTKHDLKSVSYTHLTLPTILLV